MTLTVSDLTAYLDANLIAEEGQEAMAANELDGVKSRLFDNFLDEEILLAEAKRQRVQVTDEDVNAYLAGERSGEPGGNDERARAAARRNLRIQKLQGAYIRENTHVTPDDVEARLAERQRSQEPEHHLILRSLKVASQEQGEKIRREVAERRMTFHEAILAWGATPGQGEPLEVALGGLPAQVREAVRELAPGQVTRPVMVQGSTYLFFVDAWSPDTGDPDEPGRQRAYEELLALGYEEASRRLLEELRQKVRVTTHIENLPFHYVAEDAP